VGPGGKGDREISITEIGILIFDQGEAITGIIDIPFFGQHTGSQVRRPGERTHLGKRRPFSRVFYQVPDNAGREDDNRQKNISGGIRTGTQGYRRKGLPV